MKEIPELSSFGIGQVITWAVFIVGSICGTMVFAYSTFEQKTHTDEIKVDISNRLDRMEVKIDKILESSKGD